MEIDATFSGVTTDEVRELNEDECKAMGEGVDYFIGGEHLQMTPDFYVTQQGDTFSTIVQRLTPAIHEDCTRSIRISHSMHCIVPTSCDCIT